jgi:hypothetical protein
MDGFYVWLKIAFTGNLNRNEGETCEYSCKQAITKVDLNFSEIESGLNNFRYLYYDIY